MWTPLGLFLYVSISFLTETSMHNLQDRGIQVLKFLHVSRAEECNLTCDSVTDQGATVEDVKALQIGNKSPIKIFLHRIRRKVKSNTTATVSVITTPTMANELLSVNESAKFSANATNSSTESNTVTNVNNNATVTASTPGKPFSYTSSTISNASTTTISTTLSSITTVTTTAPATGNSKMNIVEITSTPATSRTNSIQLTTINSSEISTNRESSASIIHSEQTTLVPADSNKSESPVTPKNISKDTTTSFQSYTTNTTKLSSSTPKTTKSSTGQLTTITPTKVPTTQPFLEATTKQKLIWTDAHTITGGVSPSPNIKSRTTVTFNDRKNYVFPSVPAGALIKYLADKSSLMAILIFGLLFFFVSITLFAHKAFESYKRKDYVQVDYLINGMYADSDM
ncbi:uncharacterized protein C11orf24 homolog isoform X2 [Rhinoraja longicauda]